MGLASFALGRIRRPLGTGFKAGKLIFNCITTGRRPLKIAEKIGIFLIGQKNGNAALGIYVVKIIAGKVIAGKRAERALEILSKHTSCDHGLVEHGDIVLALQSTHLEWRDHKVLDARSGFFYVLVLMEKQAVDSQISKKYRTPEGFFNAADCLKDFYGSSKAYFLIKEVRKSGAAELTVEKHRAQLEPAAMSIWAENLVHLRNDVIDFLLL